MMSSTTLNKYKNIASLLACALLLGGCSHAIEIAPPLDDLRQIEINKSFDLNVGYFIDDLDLNTEVATLGGGEEEVKYYPYRDTQAALNTMLSKVFNKVYSVKDVGDSEYLAEKGISYVFTPTIKTDSSSSSALTWPPTRFTFELNCSAVNLKGVNVWEKTVQAIGTAEYSEFIHDVSLSARRASAQAFAEMMKEISNAKQFE